MNKKICRRVLLFLGLIVILAVSGCITSQNVEDAKYKIYHINSEGTGLVVSPFQTEEEKPEKLVAQMLESLKKSENKIKEQPAIPESVKLVKTSLTGDKLSLYFDKNYQEMDAVQEVLCRAAVVRSLTQIDGVDLIAFYVNDKPLVNKQGEPYGYMQAEDFVKNTGSSINSYEMKTMTLYYPNAAGEKLVKKDINVRFNSNQSQERVVIERLMKGPEGKYVNAVIPRGTKILGVSIKEGVCYINFDDTFKKVTPGVSAKTMVYAIVNSLTELGTVSRVQILINGESDVILHESMHLKEPLSRNLDIVEEK